MAPVAASGAMRLLLQDMPLEVQRDLQALLCAEPADEQDCRSQAVIDAMVESEREDYAAFQRARQARKIKKNPPQKKYVEFADVARGDGEMISLRRSPNGTLLWGDDQLAAFTQEHPALGR